jgi:hypothetical protein
VSDEQVPAAIARGRRIAGVLLLVATPDHTRDRRLGRLPSAGRGPGPPAERLGRRRTWALPLS